MSSESWGSWDHYLKLAAIPYAFGFLTVMFHTAMYGFPVVQILQPLNFWVGIIPSILLVAAWKGTKLVIASPWEIRIRRAVSRLGTWQSVLLAVLLVLLMAVFEAWDSAVMHSHPTRESERFDLLIIALVMLCAFAATLIMEAAIQQLPTLGYSSKIRLIFRFQRIAIVPLVAFMIFSLFLVRIYPALPQRYGFGKPSDVRLVLDPRTAPPELLESQPANSTAPVVSRSVKLLYRTGEEDLILCDQCQREALSVSRSDVFGIIWEDGGRK